MVRIRLTRHGRIHSPFYKIIAIERRDRREGKGVDTLGEWNPATKEVKIDKEKIEAWVKKGAQISDGVKKLLA